MAQAVLQRGGISFPLVDNSSVFALRFDGTRDYVGLQRPISKGKSLERNGWTKKKKKKEKALRVTRCEKEKVMTEEALRRPLPHMVKVRGIVTIRRKSHADVRDNVRNNFDAIYENIGGQKILFQLYSSDLDPEKNSHHKSEEAPLIGWAEKANLRANKVEYLVEFVVSSDFGQPGAITVLNEHPNEFFLETIAVEGQQLGIERVHFPCYSWIHPKVVSSERRIFFSNNVFLPSQTPPGLRGLRDKELASNRGDGKGMRKFHDHIYDYAVYNDLGKPEKGKVFARRTLGGNEDLPYPRRCRTGRPSTLADPHAEKTLPNGTNYYVPRDENFEEAKQEAYLEASLKTVIQQLLPRITSQFTKADCEFHCFNEVDSLYGDGMMVNSNLILNQINLPSFAKLIQDKINLQYNLPQLLARDKFVWLRDDEFGRQVLAGVNPLQIECLKAFPPVSKLDPKLYGSPESAFIAQEIQECLGGLTVEKAMEEEKLFILDYHDMFMPFLKRINALEGRKMYASRTIFYLNSNGTLTPVAIELSLPPPLAGAPANRRVFRPGRDGTTFWLWQFAKAHVSSNDAGYHQLVNHWLRCHAAMEPYILATHRQLSSMHPIFKLLQPHMRDTLEINAEARQLLISAAGVIETSFTPGPYSMEISAVAYKLLWRFDMEGLPADLLRRGMAKKDPSKPCKIDLVIKDYPYAADGMLIWSSIEQWVTEYVDLYYPDNDTLVSDVELKKWWDEIRYEGHVDKKDEEGWPTLETKEDAVAILTNMIWIASAQHAAINFGQYTFGGYVPARPCLTRRLIPETKEHEKEYLEFLANPEKFFLSTIPNRMQATILMSVLDSLSTHSPNEEYLGQRLHSNWTADPRAKAAFADFSKRIEEVDCEITRRNADGNLKNRAGAGVLPYELLRPTSKKGVTGRGIPNSISI